MDIYIYYITKKKHIGNVGKTNYVLQIASRYKIARLDMVPFMGPRSYLMFLDPLSG